MNRKDGSPRRGRGQVAKIVVVALVAAAASVVVLPATAAQAATGDAAVGPVVVSGTTGYTQATTRTDGTVNTTYTLAGAGLAQSTPAIQTMPQRNSANANFNPTGVNSAAVAQVSVNANGCVLTANTLKDCGRTGTLTVAFDKPVSNPTLHLSGLGGYLSNGNAHWHAYLDLASATSIGGVTAPVTFGTPLTGATNLSVVADSDGKANNRVRAATNAPAAVCDTTTANTNSDGTAGCGSVVVQGTNLTKITLSTGLYAYGVASTLDATNADAFNLTTTMPNAPPFALSLTKTNPTSLTAGSVAAYGLTVTNNGAGAAPGATVTDKLPANFAYTSVSNSGWTCTASGTVAAGQTVVCTTTNNIAANATSNFTINATPTAAALGTSVRNLAAVDPSGQASPVDPATCTANGTPAGCAYPAQQTVNGKALTCTAGDIYTLDATDHNFFVTDPDTGNQSLAGNIGAATGTLVNALAITDGTGLAYALSGTASANSQPTVYRYDPTTNTTTSFNGPTLAQTTVTTATTIIAGAINPVNGIYYFGFVTPNGTANQFEIYGFNTNTNTAVAGRIATIAIPANTGTPNGDIVFDRVGRMYLLATTGNNSATANPLLTVVGLPGATGANQALNSKIIAYLTPNNSTFNGMAFDLPTGYLYVTGRDSAGASFMKKINPSSGAQVANYALASSGTQVIDAASCNYNNSIVVQKNIVNRAAAGDQFTVSIADGGLVSPQTATTTGTTRGLQDDPTVTAGPVVTLPGNQYTISEAGANGASLTNYTTTYVCTNLLTNGTIASGTGASATVTAPTTSDNDGVPVGCVFTNSAYLLSLRKSNPATLAAGQPSNYTFAVTNSGKSAAPTATVVDRLPANVAYTSSSGAGWTCTATGTVAAGQTVTCTFAGSIAAGATNNALAITVTPNSSVSRTSVQNKAAVDPTGGTSPVDPTTCTANDNPAGCAVAASQTVVTGVVLGLTKSAASPSPVVGYPSVYTLKLTNTGVNAAAGATVREQLPPNTSFNSATGATCTVTGGSTTAGQQLTCTVAAATSIAAGGGTYSFTVSLTPLAAAAGTSIVNRASVDADGGTNPVTPSTCTATGTPGGCAVAPSAAVVADVVKGPSPSFTTTVGTPIASIDVKSTTTSTQGKTIVNPTIATQPANGTVTVNADGTLRYVPNAGFSGSDPFTYTICNDGNPAACDTEPVAILVQNVFTPGPAIVTAQNTSITTPLNQIATTTGKPLDPTRVTQVTAPAHGTISISASTGAVTYIPNAGYTGTDSYAVQVCDTSSPVQCTTITKAVTVGANTVTAVNDTATTAPATAVSINVRANDTSQTGQPLANPTITTAPSRGTAVVNADGTVTYTPTSGKTGTDSFTYRVCDTSNPTPVCSSATVTVTVPNTVTLNNDAATTPQNTTVVVPLLANDTVSAGGSPLDPSTTRVTIAPTKGTVTVSTTTGAATYVPNNGYTGTDTFTYQVCDTSSPTPVCKTATATITVGGNTVTAVNDTASTTPGAAVSTDVRANDTSSTGQPLANPTVVTNPTKGTVTVDATTGRIVYTPTNGTSGVDTYRYQVCDTSNPTPVCSQATVTVTVANTVTAVGDSASTPQNTAVAMNVPANDTVSNNGAPLDLTSVTVTTAPAHGSTSVNATSGVVTYTPANGYTGTDSYAYRICDKSTPTPTCATATATVTVGANTVTANPDTDTTTPGVSVTTNVRTNDTTSTGQPLANPTVTTQPTKGSTTVNANGTITYTPANGTSGVDTYRYQVCDTSNPTPICATTTVTITVANAVKANDDVASTTQNTPVTVTVLGNDTVSTNGAPLDPATVVVTTPAQHGTSSVNAAGAIVYTPNNGYTGTDTLTYKVCDKSTPTSTCSSASVTITVGANKVTAVNDTASTTPGTAVTTNVRGNDTTQTGQALANPVVQTQATKGTAVVNANDGTITYTPRNGTSGTDSYTYTVCDTSNPTPVCAQATVTVTVTNTVTAVNDSSTTPQNTSVVTTVLGNDTVSLNGAPLAPSTVAVTTAAAHGTTSVNTSTGAITYTPNNGYTGTDSYVYQVCDTSNPTATCASASVSITVGGNAVTARNDTATTTPGTGIGIDVRANDTSTTGQALANPTIATQPAKGTATVTAASGRIIYTPTNGTSGVDSFTYQVCDTSNPTPVCSTATVTVTVVNTVTAVDDSGSTQQNSPITTNVISNDTVSTNGSPLRPASVSVTTPAGNGSTSVNTTTGAITYTPATGFSGIDTYRYQVCDGSTPTPYCSIATVTINVGQNVVTAANDSGTTPPVTAVTTDVRANDTTGTGQPLANPAVTTAPNHGTTTVNANGTITYLPSSGFSGIDTYDYQVCDTSTPTPACASATVTITVTNTVNVVRDTLTVAQNTAGTADVLANDSVATGGAPLNKGSVTITSPPANGTTSINPTSGAITYTPKSGFSGNDVLTYQVCDSAIPSTSRTCGRITLAITVTGNVVTAKDDTDSTTPGVAAKTDVLGNDTTATGQPLGTPTIATNPAKGTVTVNADKTISYVPNPNTSGVDTYRYQICDTSNPTPACSTATVTITVTPTINAVNDASTTPQNTSVVTSVLGNDTTNGAPLNPAAVSVTTAPLHGTTSVNTTTGDITFTPAAGYSGLDTYVYQVCDKSTPTPYCKTAVVTITISPNTVTARPDTATTQPGTSVTVNVRSNDTSASNQALKPPTITANPARGTAIVDGTGSIVYTPNNGTSGTDVLTYQVCDTGSPSVCDSTTLTITVPNTVTAVNDTATTTQNKPVSTPVLSNDTVTANGSPLNKTTLQVTSAPAKGTTSVNTTTGEITYTPNNGYTGSDSYSYRICDGSQPTPVCVTATVTVTVGGNVVAAGNDTATTNPATPVDINLRGNDTSSTGQPLGIPTITTAPGKGRVTVNASTGIATYTPDAGFSGTDTFDYQVCDTSNPTPVCANATVTVTVNNTVTANNDTASTAQNTPVTTSVLANDTVSLNGAPLAPSSVTVTSSPTNGQVSINGTTGAITYTPNAGYNGTDSYTYNVCDTSTPTRKCASATVSVTVGGNTVTANADSASTTPRNPVTTNVRANDTTATGQPLAAPTIAKQPTKGSVSVNANGSITYTPANGTSGIDTYDYQVCDTSNPTPFCSTATVTVTVTNTVTAVADSVSTAQNTPVTVSELDNDSVTAGGAPLDTGAVTITTAPTHGTVVVNPDGTTRYTPTNGYTGTDSYGYRVCDKSTPTATCATSTVTVSIGGNSVSATNDSATTPPGTAVTVDVRANDTSSTGQPFANPTIVTAPARGTAVVNANGTITYTPTTGTSGTDSLVYRVCDTSTPTPFCANATLSIAVTNQVTAVADTDTTPQNTAVTTPVPGNDTVSTNGAPLDPTSVTITTAPAHGTATVIQSTGAVRYVPATGYSGTDSYTYRICDKSAPTPVCDSAPVTITVGLNTVTAVDDAVSTSPGNAVSTNVRANDTTATGQPLANPTVTTAPAKGTAVVNADGTITYTPNTGTSGRDTYRYRVCDTSNPTAVCATATVTVNVTNTVTAVDDESSTAQNTPVAVPVLGNDKISANGAPLDPASVTVTTPAGNGTTSVNTTTGAINYTPTTGFSGIDTFTYRVCDTSSPTPVCNTAKVTVNVGANRVSASNDSDTTSPGVSVITNVVANDSSGSGQPLAKPTVSTQPQHGSAVVGTDGRITYRPDNGFAGVDSYTYQVCDTSATPACDSATVTINVINVVTATNDSVTVAQNNPAAPISVLTNDTVSPNGPALNPASVTVTTAPTNGSATANTNGTVTYKPNPGFSGRDSFAYRVCDTSTPTPVCAVAQVAITVSPNTVTAGADTIVTQAGTPVTVDLRGNDTSASGQPLAAPTITTQPTLGVVVVNNNGTVTYTPTAGKSGTDSFGYSICDTGNPPACSQNTATASVSVNNVVTAVNDSAATPQNRSIRTSVLDNDTVSTGGSPLNPASVTVTTAAGNGTTSVDATTGAITYTPNNGYSGSDSYKYTVCDSGTPTPKCATATVSVTVGGNTVVANNDSDTTTPGNPVTTVVRNNDSSASGQPFANPTVTTPPGNGTATVNNDGSITYTPRDGTSGTDTYRYQVCDTSSTPKCASATVTITVVSSVTARPDSATVAQNGSVQVSVLANDSGSARGAPLNPASVAVTSSPANGQTSVLATGEIVYTPNKGYTGPDTFSYQVCDKSTGTPVCASTTVSITVGANAVDAVDDAASTTPGTAVTTDVRRNDTSASTQPLAKPTVVDQPNKGTVAVNADGTITYTPTNGTSGVDTYTYKVCDTGATSVCDTATVTVTVANTVTAGNDTSSVAQNGTVAIRVLANDSVATNGAPLDPASVTVLTAPQHGTATVDTATGAISFAAAAGYSGSDSFTYRVCDKSTPTAVCATATVTVSVGQNTVTAGNDSATTTPGNPVSIDVRSNDSTSSGQPLAPPTIASSPAKGTVAVTGTGAISYTPNSGTSGVDTFTYRVCDTGTSPVCATATVTVTVANTVTVVNDSASTQQNKPVDIAVLGNDTVTTGGAPLRPATVAVTTTPANGTVSINGTTGVITYTPNNGFSGTNTFSYQVCDGSSPTPICGTAVVAVTVGGNSVAANNDSDTTSPGTAVTTDVKTNDSSGSGQPLGTPTVTVAPKHGTATVTNAGTITYQPDNDFSGVDSYTYQICDTGTPQVCGTAVVTVSVPNRVGAVADSASTPQNKPVTTPVLGNDTIATNGAPLAPSTVTVTGAPSNGTTTVNATTGAVTYTPAAGFSGTDSYTYRVCDTSTPTPVCDSAPVTVTVAANAVTARNDTATTTAGTPVRTDVTANDSSASGQSLANPTVTTAATKGTTTVNGDGSVTYTPNAGTSGTDSYSYQVCDTGTPRSCATATVTVTVTNVVTAVNDTATVAQNGSVSTPVLGNDTVSSGGAPLNPASVTATTPAHGQVTINTTTGAITYVPTTGYTGPDSYGYTVCDKSTPTPVCAAATVNVTVAANTVTAGDDTASTTPGTAVIVTVTGNDRSASGQALANPTVTVPATKGTATVNGNGTITYSPNPGTSGTDTFGYQICDTGTPAACASAVVTVAVNNTVSAVDDPATVAQNGTVAIDVLGNDKVATNGAPLNAGSVVVTVAPAHGTTSVSPSTGAVTYTPAAGYSGSDTFTYRVCDTSTPTPVCGIATARITVGANLVTAAADSATTAPGNPVTTDVRGNDTSSSKQALANPTVVSSPAKGTTKVNADGTITYTPNAGTSGTDTYRYQVCDTGSPAVCSTATVTVTVANTVTVVNDSASTPQNTAVTTAVLGNDTISTGGAPLNPASVTVTVAPTKGTTSVNASSGAITYTPNAGTSGADSYTYQVCDRSTPTPVCGSAVVTVNVGGNMISANGDSATTTPGTAVTTNVRANDSSGSGQPFAAPTVASAPAHGTATVNGSGNIVYVPAAGFSGTDSYTYQVCDTSTPAVCGTATVTVTVTNTVTAVADSATTAQNQPVTTDVLTNDKVSTNGAPLDPASVTITGVATHGTTSVNRTTGAVTYTPNGGYSGPDTYTYQVCDTSTPTVVCSVATVSVTVTGNTVTAADDTATTGPGAPVTTDVRSNDRSTSGQALAPPVITTQPAKGTVVVTANGSITYTPNAGTSGTDSYGYRVCDTGSTPACATATVTVSVINTVTAVADTAGTQQNKATTTDVLANDTVATGGAPLNPGSVSVVSAPAHGQVTVSPSNGRITYVPTTGYSGTDSYRYQVCDSSTPTPLCSTATVSITVGGNTVSASDDTVTTAPGNPVTANVLANDSTSSGQTLAPPTIVTQPTKGTVTVNPDGTVTYTPTKGTSGSDSFTYQVCDTGTPKACSIATATVTVGVVNQVDAVNDLAVTAQNQSVTTNVTANDTVTPDAAPLDPASVSVTVPATHGTTTVNPAGTVTYTPNTGYSGSDSYTYRVCDTSTPTPVCDTAVVNVTVGGDAVAANDDSDATTPGTPVTTDVRVNDSTSSGQPLDLPTITSNPAKGSVAVNPNGTITYTPNTGTAGRDSYVYQVCDTGTPRVCGSATVTITVTNTVTATPDSDSTPQNQPVTTTVLANDTVSARGPSLNPGSVVLTTTPAHGTAAVNANGTITYTPTRGYSGPDAYGYRVCDRSTPTPVCDTTTVTLTVGAGIVTARPDTASTTPGTPVTTDVRANDSSNSGQSLAAPKIVSLPANGTVVVNNDGTITYTPAPGTSGADSYSYQVCDTGTPAVCATGTVTVSVLNTVTAKPDTAAVAQNGSVTTPVLGNDTVSSGGAPLDPTSVTITGAPTRGTTSVDPTTGAVTYTPTRGYSGADSYTYRVCDTSSPTPVCSSAKVSVVVGSNTVVAGSDSASTAPDVPVTVDVRTNDSSSSGQDLANPTITTQPQRGTVTVNPDGSVTYTPTPGTSGTDTFGYRVCDTGTPQICSVPTTVTVSVANTVQAVNDNAATAQNKAVTTDVLANDTVSTGGAPLNKGSVSVTVAPAHGTTSVNPTTGAITFTPDRGFSGTDTYTYRVCDASQPTPVCGTATVTVVVGDDVVAANPDSASTVPGKAVTTNVRSNDSTSSGQPFAVPTIATQPKNGTVVVNADGTITYTPTAGTSGTDSYDYRVCDTGTPAVCATTTVTVTVTNKVTAVADTAMTDLNNPVTTNVLGNDTVSAGGAPLNPGSVRVVTAPKNGTTAVSPTGAITYTPATGFGGTDSYTYEVCDTSSPTPVCSTATVTVTVDNGITARDDAAATAPGSPVTINVRGNDASDTGNSLAVPTLVRQPSKGTVTTNANGTMVYTPTTGTSGTDTFDYQVCDTSTPPLCMIATVTVTVANAVNAVDDSVSTPQNKAVATPVLGNDTVSTNGSPLDPASVSVVVAPTHGTTTVDTTTGVITYTPANGYTGPDTYTYRVCDGSTPTPVCDTAVVTVTVGRNTVSGNDDSAKTKPGRPVTTPVLGNDSSGTGQPLDPSSVTVTVKPGHGTTTVDPVTGAITYTPAKGFTGKDSYRYRVCDTSTPTPVCDVATVTVTVGDSATGTGGTGGKGNGGSNSGGSNNNAGGDGATSTPVTGSTASTGVAVETFLFWALLALLLGFALMIGARRRQPALNARRAKETGPQQQ